MKKRFLYLLFLIPILGCKSQVLDLQFGSNTNTTGAISIVGNPQLLSSRTITLALSSNKATEMAIFNGVCNSKTATWEPFASSKTWTIVGADGLRTISILFRDGDKFQSECLSSSVTLDTTPPTPPSNFSFVTTISGRFSTPKFSFTASSDLTTSVMKYQARLLKSPSLEEVAIWTDLGVTTSGLSLTGLNLVEGQNYIVEVRAVDLAGNLGSALQSPIFRAGPFLNISMQSGPLSPGIYKIRFELSTIATSLITFNYSTEEVSAKAGFHFKALNGTGSISTGKYFFDTYLEVLGYPYYDAGSGSSRDLRLKIDSVSNAGANEDSKLISIEHLAPYPQMSGIKKIVLKDYTLCALSELGNVFCGGYNFGYNLGKDSVASDIPFLSKATDLSDVMDIGISQSGSCAIVGNTRQLHCWGNGVFGVPNGVVGASPLSFTGVQNLGIGIGHGCFRDQAGNFYCSGANSRFQQGHSGSDSTSFQFVKNGYSDVDDIIALDEATCLRKSGRVLCFGDNTYGQIGLALTTSRSQTESQISSFSNVTALSGYGKTACLIDSGNVHCWGSNSDYILGNTSDVSSYVPRQISLPANVQAISVGKRHACALVDDTNVYCWGRNSGAAFGATSFIGDSATPVLVLSGAEKWTSISAGVDFSCVINEVKVPKCWGTPLSFGGNFGGVNVRRNIDSGHLPLYANLGLGPLKAIKTARNLICVQTNQNRLYCWGISPGLTNYSQMSTGLVHGYVPKLMFNGNKVKEFAVGLNHVCGILESSSQVVCVGKNHRGQLGTGTTISSMSPIAVSGLSGATKIAIAGDSTCALLSSGSVSCWGDNSYIKNASMTNFAVGDYANSKNLLPVSAAFIGSDGADIVGSDNTFCFLSKAKKVKCWGYLNEYVHGTGGLTNANGIAAADVVGVTGADAIYAGVAGFCAREETGELKCWGYNSFERFGNAVASSGYLQTATLINGATGLSKLDISPTSTCIIDSTSAPKCMGFGGRSIAGSYLSSSNYNTYQGLSRLEGGLVDIAILEFGDLQGPVLPDGYLPWSTTYSVACGITISGEMVCWGNGLGTLGLNLFMDGAINTRPTLYTPYSKGD